jgi:hypothetical protein
MTEEEAFTAPLGFSAQRTRPVMPTALNRSFAASSSGLARSWSPAAPRIHPRLAQSLRSRAAKCLLLIEHRARVGEPVLKSASTMALFIDCR